MIDVNIAGRELGEVTFPVERSKLAELARAFGDHDPVWHEPGAARAAGFADVPTPPTVTVLTEHWREGGVLAMVAAIGADPSRVLHGEATWEYHVPVRLGDILTARQTVRDVASREGKRGGTMTMVTIDTTFTNQRGELAVVRTDTLIEREK